MSDPKYDSSFFKFQRLALERIELLNENIDPKIAKGKEVVEKLENMIVELSNLPK